jgi:hypothetical protein
MPKPSLDVSRDTEKWRKAVLFPGQSGQDVSITYDSMYKNIKEILVKLQLCFEKVTHIFRIGGARLLDAIGVDDEVSMSIVTHLK